MLGAGIFLCASVFASSTLCVVFLILAGVTFGLSSSNVAVVTQTLAGPRASGRWTGLQYSLGNLSGVVAPALTGYTVDHTGHFFWAFCIAAAFCVASALCWAYWVGQVEPVEWKRRSSALTERVAIESA
jgi:MFS family permease